MAIEIGVDLARWVLKAARVQQSVGKPSLRSNRVSQVPRGLVWPQRDCTKDLMFKFQKSIGWGISFGGVAKRVKTLTRAV
jgi:hypothetical protein